MSLYYFPTNPTPYTKLPKKHSSTSGRLTERGQFSQDGHITLSEHPKFIEVTQSLAKIPSNDHRDDVDDENACKWIQHHLCLFQER